jgi:TPR repeat protein
MAIICTARSALAVFLSLSLLSTTGVAQPLAQNGTRQFPEDQPGFPQYPTAQPTIQRGSQTGTRQFPEDQPGFPQYPTAQPAIQRGDQTGAVFAGAASLNFPPDRNDSVALQCDQLADDPFDAQRVGAGVDFEKIQVDQALPVCKQAAERQPVRPRYQDLYGRVLDAAKRYPEAAAQYTAADRAGYGWASFTLAGLYQSATGVRKDLQQALRLYIRAGNAGIADGFDEAGAIYAQGNPPNYLEAKTWFERAVQGGSADGYADLGTLYGKGLGVNKDPAMALSLFNQAARRGSPEGMYRVGLSYLDGVGVQDLTTACQWFLRAAAYNHPYAEGQAGICYYNGTGVAQNHETAFNMFVLAGQAGLADGRVSVADMLDRGDGHNQDSAAAVAWYQAAAEQGDVYAMTELGAHLRLGKGVAQNEAQAMQWFAKAAQTGYVPAETSLAIGYENGLGQGRPDYQQAAKWFGKAADQDDGYAQLNLGVMYEKGWGVPQNLLRAKQLYARAAGSSNTAVANLGKQYFSDIPVSAAPGRTPERTAVSSSKDSSNFWSVVIVGALAVGALALFTSVGSGKSSGGVASGGGTPTTTGGGFGGSPPASPAQPVTAFPGPPPPHPCFGNIGQTLNGTAGMGSMNVCR